MVTLSVIHNNIIYVLPLLLPVAASTHSLLLLSCPVFPNRFTIKSNFGIKLHKIYFRVYNISFKYTRHWLVTGGGGGGGGGVTHVKCRVHKSIYHVIAWRSTQRLYLYTCMYYGLREIKNSNRMVFPEDLLMFW